MCIRFFFQAEDGMRYLVRSRGLGDVYKGQAFDACTTSFSNSISSSCSVLRNRFLVFCCSVCLMNFGSFELSSPRSASKSIVCSCLLVPLNDWYAWRVGRVVGVSSSDDESDSSGGGFLSGGGLLSS